MKKIKDFLKVIYKNKQAFIGLIILILFVIMAIVGSFINVDMTVEFSNRYQNPSLKHILGTDYAGRDTFLQLVKGSKDVLTIGICTGIFSLMIGFTVGSLSGFLGGWVDHVLMFITNIFITIPSFPVMMIISTLIAIKSNVGFAAILSIWSWAGLARAIRAQILSLKHRDFIKACKIMGLKTSYILFEEIMPNLISYIAINFIMIMQNAIVASVGLMLLGLAPYSPTNWGMMIQLAIQNTGGIFNPKGYLYLLSTIGCLGLFQMGCIFFASGIDEAMNPRLRS